MADGSVPRGKSLATQVPMEKRMSDSQPHPRCLSHLLQGECGASFMEVALVSSLLLVVALLMLLAMQSQA